MHLKLSLSNESRVLPGVQAFVRATLLQMTLPKDGSERLGQLVTSAVNDAIENAYPSGEEGLIKLTISELAGKLEIRVRDFGLPQDVEVLEKRLHESDSAATWLHGSHAADAVDQMHWLAFGPQGKALQLIKWLHTENIADTSSVKDLAHAPPDAPLAPEQQYTVRRMLPEEAVQVSQLMYRTYGTTYFNEDVYYPGRIATQNLHEVLLSVVAVGKGGRLAGHCALERNQEGSVAEIGQAAVDPAHRGRGLLDRMKEALEIEARALGLVGWYADAVAVHIFTQQSNAHHGGHVCGLDLAVSPKTEAFRKIASEQPQRVSCVLYFHWLGRPQPRTVFVPSRHQEIVAAIYQNLQCPFEFGEPASPTPEHGTLTVKVESRAALATIRAGQLGKDSARAIRHAGRELVERSRVEVVVVELPLAEPATAEVCEALEADGLAFTGIGPHFSPHGDVLKLTYLVEPLAREPIKTFEPFADRLVNYALAEQERVRTNL
jgi:anti-sigma regulatory factor (Ser/Thr protein kinase)/GNAT superfamily N-acetyltransferase